MQNKKSSNLNDDIGLSLIETIRSSDLSNVALDLGEVGLDAILKDGIFRELPVINTIVGVAKTVLAVRDKLLVKKIYSFLKELQDVSEIEKQKFVADMENDPNHQRQVGENLIMLLDRLDDLNKPMMIAKIFKAYLKGNINYHQFQRFASVIDRMLIKDLQNLLEAISSRKTSPNVFAEYLYSFGLSKIEFDDSFFVKAGSGFSGIRPNNPAKYFPPNSPLQFHLSTMTFLLAQILLNRQVDTEDYIAKNRKELEKVLGNK